VADVAWSSSLIRVVLD